MSIFSGGIFSKENLKKTFNSITEPIKNLADKSKHLIQQGMEKSAPKIEFNLIYPRIFWMAYPTKEKAKSLANIINTQFKKNKYFIWNVSEHKYETDLFENQVAEYCFVGYPCPPIQYLFIIIRSVIEWLNADAENVAIIHCQSSKCRSALVISCLLSVLKVVNHPMEALSYFCTKLRLEQETLLFPPQIVALRNFANIMDDIKLNNKVCVLKKVLLSEVPKLELQDKKKKSDNTLHPYIQIFKGSTAIYNYLTKEEPKAYKEGEGPITFAVDIELTDEILVRCRHFVSSEERISVCRILFHPMMAFTDSLKFAKKDIEFSPDITVSEDFYMELEVKFTDKDNQELLSINKLKQDCQKEAEEYRKNKEKEKFLLPKTISVKKVDKKPEEEINPLQDVYEKIHDEPDVKVTLTTDEKPVLPAEKASQILTSIAKTDEEEEEEDPDEYLRKLEEKS